MRYLHLQVYSKFDPVLVKDNAMPVAEYKLSYSRGPRNPRRRHAFTSSWQLVRQIAGTAANAIHLRQNGRVKCDACDA